MKINHRHYILVLFAVISIVISIFIYLFVYKKTIGIAQNYSKIVAEINSEDGRKIYESELIKIYDKTKTDRKIINNYIISEGKIVDFIEMVERIGDYTNTKFELSSISNDKNIIKAKVHAEGSWSNVMRALLLIENIPISSKISNITLFNMSNLDGDSVKIKSSDAGKWKMNLDIEAITTK